MQVLMISIYQVNHDIIDFKNIVDQSTIYGDKKLVSVSAKSIMDS